MKRFFSLIVVLNLLSCGNDFEKTSPSAGSITESIYASGYIKSDNQYSVIPKVGGIIDHVYVESGDLVIKGSPIISIYDENQQLNSENAALTAKFYDFNSNVERLKQLFSQIDLAKAKMINDSSQYERQVKLSKDGVGIQVDLENSALTYKNSSTVYKNSIRDYYEYKRQLDYNSSQAKKNVQILGNTQRDFTVYSEIEGKVYNINVNKGEMVNQQTIIAVLGDAQKFVLEMQIDENDILKIKLGMEVIVSMDSYPDEAFKAVITKINPYMDKKSKTFVLEAEFVEQPSILYPNMNFEANIILQKRDQVLLIPRNYVVKDSLVINAKGDTLLIKTGLKDYKMVEILSGISATDILRKPE